MKTVDFHVRKQESGYVYRALLPRSKMVSIHINTVGCVFSEREQLRKKTDGFHYIDLCRSKVTAAANQTRKENRKTPTDRLTE